MPARDANCGEPHAGQRYVRRDDQGHFKESDNVSRSLSQDVRKKASRFRSPDRATAAIGSNVSPFAAMGWSSAASCVLSRILSRLSAHRELGILPSP